MKYHPDRGGDTKIMQEIVSEYDLKFKSLKSAYNFEQRKANKPETTETPDKFREIIEVLVSLNGIKVELCGSWLWISGSTYQHREVLKKAGCQWSKAKNKWYWYYREAGKSYKKTRGFYSMNQIRNKYGSTNLNLKNKNEETQKKEKQLLTA